MRKTDVGGQALIEGVMMQGKKCTAAAVRKPSGSIKIKERDDIKITKKYRFLNIPFIRGFFIFIQSLITGMQELSYSASLAEDPDEKPGKFEMWLDKKFGKHADNIIITLTMIISVIFSAGLFILIPTAAASFFKNIITNTVILNLIEAFIRIGILILYIFLAGKMEDMERLFQYHGAEHKTIFCYENEEELTVENVKKQSRFHPRCGTNFLFLIVFVSIIIFSLTGWAGIKERILLRFVLIPIVTGISYEIIKWLGRSESFLGKIAAYPGLKLQILTTREPDNSQIEVAIAALKAAEGIEDMNQTIEELLNDGTATLKENGIDTARLDTELLLGFILEKDRLFLITHKEEKVSATDAEMFFDLIEKRRKKTPIKYILSSCEFMGADLYLEEGVLIPRDDTELLVEEVLKEIPEDKEMNICDLCCGSGAIAVALAKARKNIKVDALDLYPQPEKVTVININKHKLSDRVKFIKSDLLEEVIKEKKTYDIIVSNPPYIEEEEIPKLMEDVKNYEPHTALSGGKDGLDFYRKIVKQSVNVLKENGTLAFEIGYNQGNAVKTLMEEAGFKEIKVLKDFASLDRMVIGKNGNDNR